MAVPQNKKSKMKSRKRRTHYTAISPTLSTCPNCGNFTVPHTACPACGRYRDRKLFEIKVAKTDEKA
ncbi:MAG: 50S ribosomal protein L32 [Deltaproteobacteria bacterium]|jgi:large subunit ribosomal protein L32|nr:50S ribosomal protein L32 [Deltaproteobacteria bacterium]